MSRSAAEPFPIMRTQLLPETAGWKREGAGNERQHALSFSGAVSTYNDEYLAGLDDGGRRMAATDATYRSLESFDESDYQTAFPAFVYVREAAANIARIAGARRAQELGNPAEVAFGAEVYEANAYAKHLSSVIMSGLAARTASARSASASTSIIADGLVRRFSLAFRMSFTVNAFGVGRGQYSPAEMAMWPVLDTWDQLKISYYPDGERRLRKDTAFDGYLVEMGEASFAGHEPVSWRLARSFLFDVRPTANARRRRNFLAPERQHETVEGMAYLVHLLAELVTFTPGAKPQQIEAVQKEVQSIFAPYFAAAATTGEAPVHARPSPMPYGVSPRGAEQLCCDWMRHLGSVDAEVTSYGGDGGVDVVSREYVAQVKHYTGAVGAPEVQQLVGVAYTSKKLPLFFTSGRYTPAAIVASESVSLPLFVYSAENGTLDAANSFAEAHLLNGLG